VKDLFLLVTLEFETATAKWKKYKSPRNDQILGELIKPGETVLPVIHKGRIA
jgi:hypothetical protein